MNKEMVYEELNKVREEMEESDDGEANFLQGWEKALHRPSLYSLLSPSLNNRSALSTPCKVARLYIRIYSLLLSPLIPSTGD